MSCPGLGLRPVEPTVAAVVGIAGVVVGWGLKTMAESWTWRRQQVLEAYIELLDTVDRCAPEIGRVWNPGQRLRTRDEAWVDRAMAAQLPLDVLTRDLIDS
jgi:hypothetical protein